MNKTQTTHHTPKSKHFLPMARSLSSVMIPRRELKKPAGFVSALAHEVRNPLSNINLSLEMLLLTKLDDEQRQYLEIVGRSAGRINHLINTLLMSDRVDEVELMLYPLRELLEDALRMVNDRVLLKHISICREYAETDHKVSIDREKMTVAVANILINAVEAMASAGGALRLVTRSAYERDTIEIHDNGKGIGKSDLEKIFQPYFTNKQGGMGLGLAATLEILKANRARVDVRSEEGAGTSFILSFDRI